MPYFFLETDNNILMETRKSKTGNGGTAGQQKIKPVWVQ